MDVGLGLIFFNLLSLLNVFALHISSSLYLFSTLRQYSMDFDQALWLQTTRAEHLLPPHPDQRQRPPRAEQHRHADRARVQLRRRRLGDVLQRWGLRPPCQPEQGGAHRHPRLHLRLARYILAFFLGGWRTQPHTHTSMYMYIFYVDTHVLKQPNQGAGGVVNCVWLQTLGCRNGGNLQPARISARCPMCQGVRYGLAFLEGVCQVEVLRAVAGDTFLSHPEQFLIMCSHRKQEW